MKALQATLRAICFAIPFLAVQTLQAGIVWFPQPSDIQVEATLKEDGTYWFVVDLNSHQISSFHVETDLTGEQHYSARDPGEGPKNPPYNITSGVPKWQFSADGGTFMWQTYRNQERNRDGWAWFFRVQNENFTESTKFKYTFDKIVAPLPATSWMLGCGLLVLFTVEGLRRRKNAKQFAASSRG